jgi:hypothetical protein
MSLNHLQHISCYAIVAHCVQHVRSLLTTLLTALPAFGNVGALLGLFFFMYAYVGVALWGDLRWNVGEWHPSACDARRLRKGADVRYMLWIHVM